MFEENKFKVEIISGLAPGSTITLYRSGEMVDLCRSATHPLLPCSAACFQHCMRKTPDTKWSMEIYSYYREPRLCCVDSGRD